MTRATRWSTAVVAALVGTLSLVASFAGAARAGNSEAISRIGSCIAGGGRGDMLLLMDRSASLLSTDPQGARIDAAKYLIRQMAAAAGQQRFEMSVAVAGFDAHYQRELGWTALKPESVNRVNDALESMRGQNHGWDTDYWNALDGARRELASRGAGARSCSFIVWFTDGQYDVEPRDHLSAQDRRAVGDPKPYDAVAPLRTEDQTKAVVDAGTTDICRPGGLADQMRSQEIVNLAVGLSTPAQPVNFDLLKRIATGAAQGSLPACGRTTQPVPGAYFPVSNIDDLLIAFDAVSAPSTPPVVQEAGVCPSANPCQAGTHRFVLDASIAAIHGLATSPGPNQRILLTPPGGRAIDLTRPGNRGIDTGGARLRWNWESAKTVSLDLARVSDKGWLGQWSLTFVQAAGSGGNGTSHSSLHLFGDISPAWPDAGSVVLRASQVATGLKFTLVHADRSTVDPASLSPRTTLSVALMLPDGTTVPVARDLSGGAIAAPQTLDLSEQSPGTATLRLTLRLVTNPVAGSGIANGTPLEPETKDFPVQILGPAEYPRVPGKVVFGTLEKAGTREATLTLQGDGCGWLDGPPTANTGPQNVTVSVTSSVGTQAQCASRIPLKATAQTMGIGLVSGDLTIATLPKDRVGAPIPVKVRYELEMAEPANASVLWSTLIGVTALGVGLPLGLLYLMKFFTARIPGTELRAGSVRGPVSDTASFLDSGVTLRPYEMPTTFLESNRRHLTIDGKTLRTKIGASITDPGFVVVEQAGAPAAGSDGGQFKGQAKLPLAVQGNWCVALNPVDPHRGDVEVTFFTAAAAHGWDDLMTSARQGVPAVVARLRSGLPSASDHGPSSVDPWAGSDDTGVSSHDAWMEPSGGSTTDPWQSTAPGQRNAGSLGGDAEAPPSPSAPSSETNDESDPW